MNKIIALRPKSDTLRPVLMLLASHRIDSILLCLRSLERFTSLGRFKKIYVVASAATGDHAAIFNKFAHSHANVEVIHCSARGLSSVANAVQNEILEKHRDDVIVKLDGDVFVAPLWLEHLLEGYRLHQIRKDIPLVSALCPVSPSGRFALNRFLKSAYPAERAMYEGQVVEENWVYHRWMWEKVTSEELVEAWLGGNPQPYFYAGFATINCAVFDRRLIEAVLPLPVQKAEGSLCSDEMKFNAVLHTLGWKNAIVSRALAHHYSFAKCEEYLRSHVPLDMVWEYLQDVWREEQLKAKGAQIRRVRPVLRVAGADGA